MASPIQGPYLQPVQVVTIEKFAESVGVRTEVVRGWVAKGYVPTVPVGKYSLVNLLVLNQMLLDPDKAFDFSENI